MLDNAEVRELTGQCGCDLMVLSFVIVRRGGRDFVNSLWSGWQDPDEFDAYLGDSELVERFCSTSDALQVWCDTKPGVSIDPTPLLKWSREARHWLTSGERSMWDGCLPFEEVEGLVRDAQLVLRRIEGCVRDCDGDYSGYHTPRGWRDHWGKCSEKVWRSRRDEMKGEQHPTSGARRVRFLRSELARMGLTEPATRP